MKGYQGMKDEIILLETEDKSITLPWFIDSEVDLDEGI